MISKAFARVLSTRTAAPRAIFSARRALSTTTFARMPVYYTKDHEWINYNPSTSIGRVGITQHAATQLGDIVFVELPNIDQDIEANTSVGSIESVKAVGEIISPASGAVVELNTDLESSPETVSDSPEADGWLYDIKVSNEAELSELMNKEKYDAYVEESH